MKLIRINDPVDGTLIMEAVGGAFDPERDRCLANIRDDQIAGGFAFQNFTGQGGSITVHMAGFDKHWCSRDLLWMTFDYAFHQLGVGKIIAPVPAANTRALMQDLRAGYVLEATIKAAFPDGSSLLLLSMQRQQCRWLERGSVHYCRNYEAADGQI